jgi:ATP-binding cassette subfamily C (CFTR/MRP) protein 1
MAKEGSVTVTNGNFSWLDPDAKPIRAVQEDPDQKKRKKRKQKRGSNAVSDASSDVASVSSFVSSVATEETYRSPITLQDINFHIESGSLVAVVGTVGSGKSSFLSAILGELEPLKDSKVYIPRPVNAGPGYVSYCAQTPWVVNDTLRGNVLFGREYDEERYQKVLNACALIDDLAVLPAGDMTEIGERGINLSGGQKARVSLARALYSNDTKLVLMDDPLSAVDAHVGEHIFSKAINGELSKGLTRILVTHHVHLLSRCDSVIVLEDGRIKHHGRYADLVKQGVDFAGAIDVSKAHGADEDGVAAQEEEAEAGSKEENLSDDARAKLKKSGKKLVKDEERAEGRVAGSHYFHYAKAGGIFLAILTCLVQAAGRGSEIASGFWLSHWAEESFKASVAGKPFNTNFYVGIYAMFGLVGVLGLTLRAVLVAIHRMRASRSLHDNLVVRILRAPVSFFDVTPTGRILNRFAADMDKVDLELTQSLSQGISTVSNVLGAIAAMIAATKGTFLVPMIPISYLYYVIQGWFRKTSTELQRINNIANSPIFADFSQTLSGTSTIRAYEEEQRFFQKCKSSFDTMNASYILVQLVNYWLGLRLDLLGGFMAAFIGGIAVATSSSGFIPAGWLGLALTYSIEMTAYLKHGVRMIATIEAQMSSVERILYYSQNVESEPDEFTDKDPAPGTWPDKGAIELKHASMRYRDGPLVLKNVSVKIKPGEKVGVCGRTGSGKSSLMVALFRISEIEKDGGVILIDGVNTGEIGTSALRLNLSIIPQDPVLFSNTVRYNLDPFANASDEEVWEVLKKVRMAEVIAALPGGLLEEVAEGGENFSQGQRQLLCIARSLLRKPKVLVMDEATASIDNETDAAIQQMIRENFKDATVLTIAHRLNTIMDSDRVLVLDDGRVAEYDSPEKLLAKEDSLFKTMIDKSRAAKGGIVQE